MAFLFWGYLLILLRQEAELGVFNFRLAPACCGAVLLAVGFARLRGRLPGAARGIPISALSALWLAAVLVLEGLAPAFSAGPWGLLIKAGAEAGPILAGWILARGLSRLQLSEGLSCLSGAFRNAWGGLIAGRTANLLILLWPSGQTWCLLVSLLTGISFLVCLRRSGGRLKEACRPGGPLFAASPLPEGPDGAAPAKGGRGSGAEEAEQKPKNPLPAGVLPFCPDKEEEPAGPAAAREAGLSAPGGEFPFGVLPFCPDKEKEPAGPAAAREAGPAAPGGEFPFGVLPFCPDKEEEPSGPAATREAGPAAPGGEFPPGVLPFWPGEEQGKPSGPAGADLPSSGEDGR